MKLFYVFLFLPFTSTICVKADAQIITEVYGNPGTSSFVPFGTARYAANENIYTETELGGPAQFTTAATAINAIRFNANSIGGNTTFNNVKIYFKNIAIASTTFTNGLYSTAGYTLVYSGTINFSAAGWKEITLNSAFTRTSGTNLQMLITRTDNSNHSGFTWNAAIGNNYNAGANTSRRYSGNTALSAATTLSASSFRPAIQLLHRFNNDAKVAAIYTLGKIPKPGGLPHTVSACISNEGKNPITNLTVTLNITGANTFTSTKTIVLLSSLTNTTVLFNTITTLNTGNNNVSVTVVADDDNTNNNATVSQFVNSNAWSYAYGSTASGGLGFNSSSGDIAAKFTSTTTADIYEVDTHFFTGGQLYQVSIWDATGPGGTPGVNLWTSSGLIATTGINVVPVTSLVHLLPGSFFVGVKQTGTTNISLSYQQPEIVRGNTFYYTSPSGSNNWTDFAPNNAFRLMIEPKILNAILPIKTEYFTGMNQAAGHLLNWKVNCSNADNAEMYIELSADGTGFKPIYQIKEPGINCRQPFSFMNTHTLPGKNYYRLKTIGIDRQVTYSDILLLNNKINQLSIMGIYPNPSVNDINIKVISPINSALSLKVLDVAGKLIMVKSARLTEGVNIIKLTIKNLAAGNYTIIGNTDLQSTQTIQFVKAR